MEVLLTQQRTAELAQTKVIILAGTEAHDDAQLLIPGFEIAPDQPQVLKPKNDTLFPPREAFLIPQGEKISTPVDYRGLVELPALIEAVNSCIKPGYEWRGKPDDHHEYWFGKIYSSPNLFNHDEELGRAFRSLPLHIIELPIEFHRFLHVVTLPVEAPSPEVMRYRIESWRIARQLFNSVVIIRSRKFLTNEQAAMKVNQETLLAKFKSLEEGLGAAALLPSEFRFFDTTAVKRIVGASKVEHVKVKDLKQAHRNLDQVGKASANGSLTLNDTDLLVA